MSTRAHSQTVPGGKQPVSPVPGDLLQRSKAPGCMLNDCHMGRQTIQHRAVNNEAVLEVPPVVHKVLHSPGQPLDQATRAIFEPRFGYDFSSIRTLATTTPHLPAHLALGAPHDLFEREADKVAEQVTHMSSPLSENRYDFSKVRIHADAKAAESARLINAQAFTVGNHIVFDAGEYAPHTVSGQKLLAHEMVHVVQQTGPMSSGDNAQPSFIGQRSPSPRLQGKWRLDRVRPASGVDASYTRGNGSAIYSVNDDPGKTGAAYGGAFTWQEQGIVHQQVGGEAQVADWVTKHYIFKNDGSDSEFLQLRIDGSLGGNAKAEDLRYARAGAVVWGRVTERTAANPTPPDRALFEIEDGGISAATIGDLGVIEVEIPIGERGSARITIPLKKVDEGTFIPFSESTHPLYDVPTTVDEVDVLLGARVEADADIETAFTGISPWISQNKNNAQVNGYFRLNWESRPSPTPRTGGAGATGPGVQGVPGIGAATVAEEILHRSPDSRESASRLARKAEEAENESRIGLHGVSAFTEPLAWPHSRAPRREVERYFRVQNTLGPTHRTIVLPKPVTSSVANQFNRVFGR